MVRTSLRKSLAKNRRGAEMAEVAIAMVGIALAAAPAVKKLGKKVKTVNDNAGQTL